MNISCAGCHVELVPYKNGIHAIEYCASGPYRVWKADLWLCRLCGVQIVAGYSITPFRDYEPGFAEIVQEAFADPWHVAIFENDKQRKLFEAKVQP